MIKQTFYTIILLCTGALSTCSYASFFQRWGANSYIANIPLFFKQYDYKRCRGKIAQTLCDDSTCNEPCNNPNVCAVKHTPTQTLALKEQKPFINTSKHMLAHTDLRHIKKKKNVQTVATNKNISKEA